MSSLTYAEVLSLDKDLAVLQLRDRALLEHKGLSRKKGSEVSFESASAELRQLSQFRSTHLRSDLGSRLLGADPDLGGRREAHAGRILSGSRRGDGG